ncbi:MAG: phospholipase [Anaerolineae bacterium]|jgi:predicted esterase|nr:phospholipase [Anaerolineae bacterium]
MAGARMTTQMDYHHNQPVVKRGELLENATAALLMVHGRGGGPASILPLVAHVTVPGFAYVVPQANGFTWYPNRFIAPRASNEPYLGSALATLGDLLTQFEAAGIPPEQTILLGFSQGACLALETAARRPRRYGGVVALSGGLIGAPGELIGYPGRLDGTPVFIGCSDVDDHIPVARVHESADLLAGLGAQVEKRIYPGMGHTVNQDEMDFVRGLMQSLTR